MWGRATSALLVIAWGLTAGRAAALEPAQRRCLAARLAAVPQAQVPISELDAFAVMDADTGRILWVRNERMLSAYSFQPGSIFKVVTAYQALRTDRVDPHEIYRCQGWDGDEGPAERPVRCWLKAGHGPVNLAKALAYSCNLYFARLGTRLDGPGLLGAARLFGLGRSTGSDLPGEVAGHLPAQATRQDMGRLAIGQGQGVEVTGLQVLSLIGAVANGGVLYSPRKAAPGAGPTPQRGVVPGAEQLRYLRDSLEEASTFGTGALQHLRRLRMAGKTGTAAWRKVEWRTHGWYMGFWPMRDPQLALVVFVHKGFGSKEAAAVARTVLEHVTRALPACPAARGESR